MHASPLASVQTADTKVVYLDYCRVFLTALVILHHSAIVYGAPGGWYFRQPTDSTPAIFGLTIFAATNQSFFMGLFFLLSAYFTESSFNRKGAGNFLGDRFKRLGIPLVFYSLVLATFTNFLIYRYGYFKEATLIQFLTGYDGWIAPGVMWFVEALLLFALIYAALRQVSTLQFRVKMPGTVQILAFALAVGLIGFFVRLRFPIGWELKPVNFQLCYFPQYIAYFMVGIIARQNNWLEQLSGKQGKLFSWLAFVFVLVILPAMLVMSVQAGNRDNYSGGWNWQSLQLCLWEQFAGISLTIALLTYLKRKWNKPQSWLAAPVRGAYAAYIFHPFVVVGLSLIFVQSDLDPMIKLAIVAPFSVIGSFLLAKGILAIPGAKRLL